METYDPEAGWGLDFPRPFDLRAFLTASICVAMIGAFSGWLILSFT